jgi:SAM-dependent methyltransferase
MGFVIVVLSAMVYRIKGYINIHNLRKVLLMKKWLQEKLICPECVHKEIPLNLKIHEEQNGDIMTGNLDCPGCGWSYPIRNGVAILLPEASVSILANHSGYNSKGMLSAYLWSHYGDLFKDPNATNAYQRWTSLFKKSDGTALDIGCAVGRMSFELSKTHSHVIGMDTSRSFIEKARELLRQRKLHFDLIIEGHITEERSCELDNQWNIDHVDFIVADALALPFPKSLFSTVSSINVLEKVLQPLKHLSEVNRVLKEEKVRFVFSDPFSWDETVSAPDIWIGGKHNGKFNGRGIDCMHRIVSGSDGVFSPPLDIIESGRVDWKIRKTENLWEHITSQFLVGIR